MTGSETDPSSSRRPSRGGLQISIAATAAAIALTGLSAARIASASLDQAAIPIGDVASLDGVVSGTVRFKDGHLVIYSGDRFVSNNSNLAVNFAAGGSLVLCPHSHLQILAADRDAGVMFAFQEGGSQQPFQVHAGDVVMTPDWRIQMAGSMSPGEFGSLQLSTSRRGELCLSSSAKAGQFFRISELAGDSVFEITGQSSIRIAGGHIDNAPGGCSCEGAPAQNPLSTHEASNSPAPTASSTPPPPAAPPSPLAFAPATAQTTVPATNATPKQRQNQHPQDVVGYVRSFIHVLFGR